MALYAIGDTHLSFFTPKPMDIFGKHWENHHIQLQKNWMENITEEDTVLVVGDISWAMKLDEAMVDLKWIHELPGKKILLRGNHDYWWTSVSKLNSLYEDMFFLQNSYYAYGEHAITGTRGWLCPNRVKFDDNDRKIYEREAHRLRLSLQAAKQAGYEKYITILHYPPTNDEHQPSLFTEVLEEFGVEQVIYGHLHGESDFGMGLQGNRNGIEYHLVSCDYREFNPKYIEIQK